VTIREKIGAFSKLPRALTLVIATKEYGLKIKLKLEEFDKSWTMTIFSNSDYAGD